MSVSGQEDSRFLALSEVAQILAVTDTQVYALVRSGALKAIKLGGRGRWRVERAELEAYIGRMYDETERFIAEHPFGRGDGDEAGADGIDDNGIGDSEVGVATTVRAELD